MESFSRRHGYGETVPLGEPIREDAPESVRVGFLQLVEGRLRPYGVREVAARVLRKRPDPNNWSEYPNVWTEAEDLVLEAPWYRFYDIVEAAIKSYRQGGAAASYELFAGNADADVLVDELNRLFFEENIAWHVVEDQVALRIGEAGDAVVSRAIDNLEQASRPTAASELRKAVLALSRRPEPDTRDAVRSALGALEANARDITGDRNATLGEILKRHRETGVLLPPPLVIAFEKTWGYANDVARHVDETKAPTIEEAVLVVGLVASAVAFLANK